MCVGGVVHGPIHRCQCVPGGGALLSVALSTQHNPKPLDTLASPKRSQQQPPQQNREDKPKRRCRFRQAKTLPDSSGGPDRCRSRLTPFPDPKPPHAQAFQGNEPALQRPPPHRRLVSHRVAVLPPRSVPRRRNKMPACPRGQWPPRRPPRGRAMRWGRPAGSGGGGVGSPSLLRTL